ncbi:helix-turn-helix transcriptional regulator [Streptomyces sp. NBS 14/10]|uniref:helix-turn-helix domain-containing protein n=1 Tax=Streptomyces sp. NBS 14/10 TaxID=1945643 RepID=UPI000B7DD2D7|nr:helix-turn-helix transcriptional regulator [Streptomyces sp. NBS 14/10]KAK1180047.1 helix-turn-helix transcriptional regulator [Streptomyces sp. NBS 14/10]NUP60697.1 helix-turn-helix transcriptional regulator [Nonomuraea sp.]NUS86414.1 helix-turn-helix transcriptional regulator [Streptomyces sp.]
MDGTNVLGEFLRARRALVRPEDAGIRGGGLRRVPGLRREEVATLAGISADYYLRLEQGRDRNPSLQVLEALADVLNLDADATAHLIGLTQTRPSRAQRSPRSTSRGRAARKPEPVPPGILQLMEGWTTNPAYVENKFTDVLAANALATAVSPNYSAGVNLLRAVLLDDSERELLRDWEELAEALIAALRANVGPDVDDPRLTELVGELSVRSEHFRRLWGRHDVHPKRPRVSRLHHPQVGDLELHASKLAIVGTDGLVLKVFHAEPDSRSAELLAILGSLAASGKGRNPTGPDHRQTIDEQ